MRVLLCARGVTVTFWTGPREHRVRRVRAGQGEEDGRRSAGAAAAGLQGGGQQHRVEGPGQRAHGAGQGKLAIWHVLNVLTLVYPDAFGISAMKMMWFVVVMMVLLFQRLVDAAIYSSLPCSLFLRSSCSLPLSPRPRGLTPPFLSDPQGRRDHEQAILQARG